MTDVFPFSRSTRREWFVPNRLPSRSCMMQTNKIPSTSNDCPKWGDIFRAVPTLSNGVFISDAFDDGFGKDPVFLSENESKDKSESNYSSPETSPNILIEWDVNAEAGNRSTDFHSSLDAKSSLSMTPHIMVNDENCDKVPDLPRQTSLAVALEVLGSVPETGNVLEGFYPPTPSDHMDQHYLQHPSPSILPSRNHFVSSELASPPQSNEGPMQSLDTKATFYLYDESGGYDNSNANETESPVKLVCDGTSTTSGRSCAVTTTSTQVQADNPPPMQSLSSFIIQTIDDPIVTNGPDSLDVDVILQEFLESADKAPKEPEEEDRRRSKRIVEVDHCYSAKPIIITDASITSTSHPPKPYSPKTVPSVPLDPVNVVVDLTENPSSSSTRRLVRTPSYIKRREENNRACRQSRMKRKAEREEAEEKMKFFLKDNKEQKAKIKQLEKEVKEVRALLVTRMTKKS